MASADSSYDWKTPEERLLFVRWIAVIAFLIAILSTSSLWLTTGRLYPLAPLSPWLGSLPSPAGELNLVILVAALIALLFRPTRWLCAFVVCDIVVLTVQDLNRIQSWSLYFTLVIAGLAPSYKRSDTRWNSQQTVYLVQAITFAAFLWSGCLKLHPFYFDRVVPAIATSFAVQSPLVATTLRALATAVPFVEIAAALALLHRRLRNGAVVLLVVITLLSLFFFSPMGMNWHRASLAWLLALALITPRLFWRSPSTARQIVVPKSFLARALFCLICGILPALGCFGVWDSYLSFGYFSGRTASVSVVFESKVFDELPKSIRASARPVEDTPYFRLQLRDWSETELGAPPSTQVAVLQEAARGLCRFVHAGDPMLVGLDIPGRTPWIDESVQERFICVGETLKPYQSSAEASASDSPAPAN